MKKIFIAIIFILVFIIIYTGFKKIFYLNNISTNKNEFSDLIKYQINSIGNEKNLSQILQRLQLSDYNIDVEKKINIDGETLVLYYDCKDEGRIKEYYRNLHNISAIEKNSTILFSLINNLKEVRYIFKLSNIELANRYHLDTLPTQYIYTRATIEKNYNQDVRKYLNNPNDFMKYNIDLNVKNITIYYKENSDIKSIVLSEEEVNTVVASIQNNNFDVPDTGINTISKIWVDLNNGYIIGIYGSDCNRYGDIIKGNGKEIFSKENPNEYILLNSVHKLLPEGLTEYIEQIVESNK